MPRSWLTTLGLATFAAAIAIRIWNALHFPLMSGYDAFAHFGYVWFLAEEGRVPPATAGWEFFQPPAYYTWMLAFWKGLPDLDPLLRLRLGSATVAAASVIPGWLAWCICRRRFPASPGLALLSAGLLLFIPVNLYSAGFLGNETFCAILSSLGLAAALWTLDHATLGRCLVLGLVLGLAMLSKFTAVVVVAAALGALVLRSLHRSNLRSGLTQAAVVTTAMLVVCGWFYGRNLVDYGNPFPLSREGLFLSQIEDSQLQGRRGFLEYVLFDPLILYRPKWPRGLSLNAPRPPDTPYSPLRESIPTGLYANAWFDGFGGFVLPRVTDSEAARRAGQALLTLGLVPTLLVVAGFLHGIRRLGREGWDDTIVVMLLATLGMTAVVVVGTLEVPTQAAVKATYLLPVSLAFAFWFALGLRQLRMRAPMAARAATGLCVLLAVTSVLVFTEGLAFSKSRTSRGDPAQLNLHGVIYAAGGWREPARRHFRASARKGWALAEENLAVLAIEEGRPLEALYRLRDVDARQRRDLPRTNLAQRGYRTETVAEYANTEAVVLDRLGWNDEALAAARRSRRLNPLVPEVHYNLGVLLLKHAARRDRSEKFALLVRQAREAFETAFELDRAFRDAQAMSGVAIAMEGRCDEGVAAMLEARTARPKEHRFYPLRTGPGDQNAAVLRRRHQIENLPASLTPDIRLRDCGVKNG